jgi:hypothetical protein
MQRSPAENLVMQRSPARIVVHADLSCEAPFYTRRARGSEGAQVLHHWARGSDSRGHGSSEVLGFAAPPLRGLLLTQTYPARHSC